MRLLRREQNWKKKMKLLQNLEAYKAQGGPLNGKSFKQIWFLNYGELWNEVGYLKN